MYNTPLKQKYTAWTAGTGFTQSLDFPPGAAGGSGPSNIKIHSLHAVINGAVASGTLTATLSVFTTVGGTPNVVVYRRRTVVGAPSTTVQSIAFEIDPTEPLIFPVNDGVQFDITLSISGTTAAVTSGDINTSYSYTSEAA